jgi:hypothetical protein
MTWREESNIAACLRRRGRSLLGEANGPESNNKNLACGVSLLFYAFLGAVTLAPLALTIAMAK